MDTLRYKGYEGTAEVDVGKQICHGRVLFIPDVITYQADSAADLKVEFEAAVDDYIETCRELGREPQKPLTGSFNVRVPPALHKQAKLRAIEEDCSLNEVVVSALECYLVPQPLPAASLASLNRVMDRTEAQILRLTMRVNPPEQQERRDNVVHLRSAGKHGSVFSGGLIDPYTQPERH